MSLRVRYLFPLCALFLLLAVTAVACSDDGPKSSEQSSAVVVPGSELRWAKATFKTEDMAPCQSIYPNMMRNEMYESVVARDSNGVLLPAIAESWEVVGDNAWRFHLREDAKFHNGRSVTAADVKGSYEWMINPDTGCPAAGRVPLLTGVEIVDDHTVDLITSGPSPLLGKGISLLQVIPWAEFEAAGGKDGFRDNPIGSGPYIFEKFEFGEVFTTRLWGEHTTRKNFFVEFNTQLKVPELGARIAGLRTGKLHIAQIDPTQGKKLQEEGELQVGVTALGTHTGFQLPVREDPERTGVAKWVVADVNVRKAMNYAIDRELLVSQLTGGLYSANFGQYGAPGLTVGYDPNLPGFNYDPAKAKELLAKAGYPNGIPAGLVTINFQAFDNFRTEVAQFVQAQFKEVGIEAELVGDPDYATWLDKWMGTKPRQSLHQMDWFTQPAMDADFTMTWHTCDSFTKFYCNEEFDKYYKASRTEIDPVARLKLLQQASAVMQDDPPYLWLYNEGVVFAVAKNVIGFAPRGDRTVIPDGIVVSSQ